MPKGGDSYNASKGMCMDTPPYYSMVSTKKYNFYDFKFTSLNRVALPQWGILRNERISVLDKEG